MTDPNAKRIVQVRKRVRETGRQYMSIAEQDRAFLLKREKRLREALERIAICLQNRLEDDEAISEYTPDFLEAMKRIAKEALEAE